MLDRIDIHIEVPAVPYKELSTEYTGEKSEDIRKRVMAAWDNQLELFKDYKKIYSKTYMRILKVFHTIADLDASEDIQSHHVSEAIQYRVLDRGVYQLFL